MDYPYSITVDKEDKIYVTGTSVGNGSDYDYFTISYDSSGDIIWSSRYNGSANSGDFSQFIITDSIGNIYITGSAFETGTGSDIVTIKFSRSIGIRNINENIPNGYRLFQNFPNPFNPKTSIKFSIPIPTLVRIVVYDITGKELDILANKSFLPGLYQIDWNAEKYSSGIYFFRIISKNFSDTKKMVLIK
jgi:hypothetical protein